MNAPTPPSALRVPRVSRIWRVALLALVWGVVAVQAGAEIGGRSARLWHYDLREFYHVQAAFYQGIFPRAGGLAGDGVGGLLGALAVAACAWTNVSLLDALGFGFSDALAAFPTVASRHSLVTVLVHFGVPANVALVGLSLVGAGGSFVALNGRLANADVLTRFAFLGLVNRTFTYHNTCDDLLLAFALVLLGRRVWQGNQPAAWGAFLLLGATVWAPSMLLTQPPIQLLVITAWLGLAVAIWRQAPAEARPAIP